MWVSGQTGSKLVYTFVLFEAKRTVVRTFTKTIYCVCWLGSITFVCRQALGIAARFCHALLLYSDCFCCVGISFIRMLTRRMFLVSAGSISIAFRLSFIQATEIEPAKKAESFPTYLINCYPVRHRQAFFDKVNFNAKPIQSQAFK